MSSIFRPGPIFTNIVLADEINRTPPKTQSALLEAMQEHQRHGPGRRPFVLEEPFFVFATQNPIELEGTYPLPEAQLDRFMFEIVIEHLPEEELELSVVTETTGVEKEPPAKRCRPERISLPSNSWCAACPSPSPVVQICPLSIVRATSARGKRVT